MVRTTERRMRKRERKGRGSRNEGRRGWRKRK
jgi:hypothetical protein